MNKVAVLDCTLRDGGYVNDFDFSKNTIKTIIAKLGKAHMDVIECGFLKNIEYDENKSLYSDVDQITPADRTKEETYDVCCNDRYGNDSGIKDHSKKKKIRLTEFVLHFTKKKWMKPLNLDMP